MRRFLVWVFLVVLVVAGGIYLAPPIHHPEPQVTCWAPVKSDNSSVTSGDALIRQSVGCP